MEQVFWRGVIGIKDVKTRSIKGKPPAIKSETDRSTLKPSSLASVKGKSLEDCPRHRGQSAVSWER